MKQIALIASFLFVSSCGFHLRGTQNLEMAADFESIHIEVRNEIGEMRQLLERNFLEANVEVLSSASKAEYSLLVYDERNSRRAVATTSNISVAEYEIVQQLSLELLSNDRKILIPRVTISAERTYTFDDQSLESSSEEEILLRQEMRRDLSEQVFRRVNASIRTHQSQIE